MFDKIIAKRILFMLSNLQYSSRGLITYDIILRQSRWQRARKPILPQRTIRSDS